MPLEAELVAECDHKNVEEMIQHVQQARIMAGDKIQRAQDRYTNFHNQSRKEITYQIGEMVLIRKFMKRKGISIKLLHYYYGPYKVVEKISNVNFVVEAKKGNKVFRETVHVDKMKRYYEREEIRESSTPVERIPSPGEIPPEKAESPPVIQTDPRERATSKKKAMDQVITAAPEILPVTSSSHTRNETATQIKSTERTNNENSPRGRYNFRPKKVVKYRH
jgi:hypothetical protein